MRVKKALWCRRWPSSRSHAADAVSNTLVTCVWCADAGLCAKFWNIGEKLAIGDDNMRKYGNILLFASALFMSCNSAPAFAGTVIITCPYRQCILRFQTNAGWEQRVHIVGIETELDITRQGSGEDKQHFRSVVSEGAYMVTVWHNSGSGFAPSAVITIRFGGGHFAQSDDGGGGDGNDRDFNDSIVSLTRF